MSVSLADVAIWLLLAVAALALLVSALGLVLMDNALDRLHFLGLASVIAPAAVAAALWVRHGYDQTSIKATLVLALVLFTAPVLSHATARAIVPRPDEESEPDASSAPGTEATA